MAKYDIKYIYEWPRNARIGALILLSGIVFFLGYFFDLSSLMSDLTRHRNEEIALKQQMSTILREEENIQGGLKHIIQIENLLSKYKNNLVQYAKLPELMNKVLNLGANNQVFFQLFGPGEVVEVVIRPPVETPSAPVTQTTSTQALTSTPASLPPMIIYNNLPIKVIAVGTYHDISNFISQVANLPLTVSIGNFTLTNEFKDAQLSEKLTKQALTQNFLVLELTLEIPFPKDEKNAK